MKEKILIIIFVLILGSILTGMLVVLNYYTAPIIEKNIEIKTKSSVMEAFNMTFSAENLEKIFSDDIKAIKRGEKLFYISRNNEVAFGIDGFGLWGPIQGVIALKQDLKTIRGITIIHQEETPGLGGRIAEKDFLARFENKKVSPVLKILPPGKAKNENEVDGITGATMTINAFEKLINDNVKEYVALIKGDEEAEKVFSR